MHVLVYDPYPLKEWAEQHGIIYSDRETLARESDSVDKALGECACAGKWMEEQAAGWWDATKSKEPQE